MDDAAILIELKARVATAAPRAHPYWVGVPAAYPVLSASRLNQAETELGFALPPLLRRVYLEVGNGGPGIPPGLMGIACDDEPRRHPVTEERRGGKDDVQAQYLADPQLWPARVLMFCEWGCNAWSCVLCEGSFPVYLFDGAASQTEADELSVAELSGPCWWQESADVGSWFERVLSGQPVGPAARDGASPRL